MWKWSDLKRLLIRKAAVDTADLGAVMWPVQYPDMGDPKYQPSDAHITVCIFENINEPDLGYTLQDVIDAVKQTGWDVIVRAKVLGLEWFGPDQNIPVLRVQNDYIDFYHEAITNELAERGIPISMKFPEYKPHVTITDEAALDGIWPEYVFAGPVEVWWGNEHYQIDPTTEFTQETVNVQ